MDHFEEHDMKEGFDRNIIRRLVSYTMGYQHYILLSFVLLILVIGIELARPIIVGVAVDDIISNYDEIRIEETEGKEMVTRLVIANDSSAYYLLEGIDSETYEAHFGSAKIISHDGQVMMMEFGEEVHELKVVSREELKDYRRLDLTRLGWYTLIFLGITVLGLIVNYLQLLLLHYTGQKIIYKIRNKIFSHIQGLSVQFFNNQPVGKIVTRVTNDTETLNEMYTSVIVNSIRNILMLVGIMITMFLLNWRMTLYVLAVMPIIIVSALLFRKFSRKIYRDVRTRVAGINTFLSEHLSGMRIVQIFSREEAVMEKFKKNNRKLMSAYMRQLILFSLFRPSMYLSYVLAMALTLYFGGGMVIAGAMTIGVMVMFLQYVSQFFDPIQQLAEQFNIFNQPWRRLRRSLRCWMIRR